jgi:hypothetical protein
MSRDGSGTYSLPSNTLAVSGDAISSTKFNSLVQDLESDANVDRPIAAGGTGASTASAARTNLGLAIGTDVQAFDAGLLSIAGLTTLADRSIYTTASDTYAVYTLTAAGRAILDDADASAQRTTLGLGTAALKNTGTSGDAVGLLNTANAYSASQTFDAGIKFSTSSSHIEMGALNSAGEIRMRTGFAVTASGGSGLKEQDHSGGNADGLGIYGHDGVSVWVGQAEYLRATSSLITSKVVHQLDGVAKFKASAGEQVMFARDGGSVVAWRNAAESTRYGYMWHDATAFIMTNEVTNGNIVLGVAGTGKLLVPAAYAATTASAANAFWDTDGTARRSTSAAKYKRDMEPITPERVARFMQIAAGAAIWYRSLCEADPADWGYYGFRADDFAEEFPQLVHWKTHETVTVEEEVERTRGFTWHEEYQDIVIEDGKAILKTFEREFIVTETVPVWREDGSPLMFDVLDKDGDKIGERQATFEKPVMETYTETVPRTEQRKLDKPEVEGFAYERVTAFLVLAVAGLLASSAPEPQPGPDEVPTEVLDLVRENEPHGEARTRLWSLFREAQSLIADNGQNLPPPTSEHFMLFARLYPHLGWLARSGAVEVI